MQSTCYRQSLLAECASMSDYLAPSTRLDLKQNQVHEDDEYFTVYSVPLVLNTTNLQCLSSFREACIGDN